MLRFISQEDNRPGERIPVLMYHELSDKRDINEKTRIIHPWYSLLVPQFEAQMEYLFQNKFKALSLSSLFNKDYDHEKGVVITFDDGLIGNYKYALPILEKYNFSATIFAIIRQISSERYMNWEQLRELSNNGISIQSHTMTHRPLGQLTDEEVFYELSVSKNVLEDKIGQSVDYVSLPHGSFHKNLINIAKEIGYSGICSSAFEYAMPMDIQFTVGRIPIKNRYRIEEFGQIVTKNRGRIFKYKLRSFTTNKLSKILGLNNYRKINRFIFRIQL
jgi:peptidoglycan/xylan/chitin deacetylase (PgdA/CDA1 family)